MDEVRIERPNKIQLLKAQRDVMKIRFLYLNAVTSIIREVTLADFLYFRQLNPGPDDINEYIDFHARMDPDENRRTFN